MLKEHPALLVGIASVALIVLGGIRCSDQKTNNQPTAHTAEDVKRELGFDPLLPAFIPELTNKEPRYDLEVDSKKVQITYSPEAGGEGPSAAYVLISESAFPVVPGGELRPEQIDGVPVNVGEYPGTTGTTGMSASLTVYWRQCDLAMSANFAWAGKGDQRLLLTDEMRAVGFKVVESIIRQEC